MRRLHATASPGEVHPTYARLLHRLLQARAADADGLLAEAGLNWPELSTSDGNLSHQAAARLFSAAMRALKMPWLGLELGASVPPSAHGPTGAAALASRNLQQAMACAARYGSLRHALLGWRLQDWKDGGLSLVISERLPLGEVRGFVFDVLFAAVLQMVGAISGRSAAALEVDLPFAAPPWRKRYAACGAGTLHFDRAELAFHVPPALLRLPCPTADAQVFASACRDCEIALAALEPLSARELVRAWLRAARGSASYPSQNVLAARLAISPRTLMRRLKSEGSSFQTLLDEERQQQALWFLQNSTKPVEEIAALLGYADTSNFSRTCRRWFGDTPAALRAAAAARIET